MPLLFTLRNNLRYLERLMLFKVIMYLRRSCHASRQLKYRGIGPQSISCDSATPPDCPSDSYQPWHDFFRRIHSWPVPIFIFAPQFSWSYIHISLYSSSATYQVTIILRVLMVASTLPKIQIYGFKIIFCMLQGFYGCVLASYLGFYSQCLCYRGPCNILGRNWAATLLALLFSSVH